MRWLIFLFVIKHIKSELWPKGVVHFDINKKDYDLHSQDEIINIFAKIEKEICVKFFLTVMESETNKNEKLLYISNPNKIKNCISQHYDFSKQIVEMTIGYKCINPKDVSRMVVEMLRSSILNVDAPLGTSENNQNQTGKLISNTDGHFINQHYIHECNKLSFPSKLSPNSLRRMNAAPEGTLSQENIEYFSPKIWSNGAVKYEINIDDGLRLDSLINKLEDAMLIIESSTCITFQDMNEENITAPNFISFEVDSGDEFPPQGVPLGKKVLNIRNMTAGTPGHKAHVLFSLLRIIGLPIESNRPDRNNYVTINWDNIEKGKEQYFELNSAESMVNYPYDFESAMHAPSNWMCGSNCFSGAQTVQPVADYLWQITMTLGRQEKLSETDIKKINLIYGHECKKRGGRP